MIKLGKVSLWIGNFKSQEDLNSFIEEKYDEEGDVSSEFMSFLEVEFLDNQFQEVDFYQGLLTKQEVFEGFSYVESFIKSIPDLDWENNNSIILIYNFEYTPLKKQKGKIQFIDVYDYVEN